MTDDLLSTPLTAHERALVLAGVEWMRAAAKAAAGRVSDRAGPFDGSDAHAVVDEIAAIPPPALQPARIGVLGEG